MVLPICDSEAEWALTLWLSMGNFPFHLKSICKIIPLRHNNKQMALVMKSISLIRTHELERIMKTSIPNSITVEDSACWVLKINFNAQHRTALVELFSCFRIIMASNCFVFSFAHHNAGNSVVTFSPRNRNSFGIFKQHRKSFVNNLKPSERFSTSGALKRY